MGEDDEKKTCLRVLLYVTNSFLIVKGVCWLIFVAFAFFVVFAFVGALGRKRRATPQELPSSLMIVSVIVFGISSIVFGIMGIIGTAKKHAPTLTASSVLLMLLFLAELAIIIVLGVYGVLTVYSGVLWVAVVSTILTIVTCALTLAWNHHIKRTRYV